MNLLLSEEIPFSNTGRTLRFQLVKKQKLLFSLALCLLSASGLLAQPAIEWDKIYEPFPNTTPDIVSSTDDGGIIIGRSLPYYQLGDYHIVKFNIDGGKEWEKTFSGNKSDNLKVIIQTSDGGYLLGGNSNSNAGTEKTDNSYSSSVDYWVIKISANGTKQWDKTYGGKNEDLLNSLKQTKDGGYILGGTSNTSVDGVKTEDRKGDYDYWIIKITSDGTKEWDKTIGGRGRDLLVYVDQTVSGNYILGGNSSSSISGDKTSYKGNFDFWIVQLAPDGSKLWDKTYGGSDYELLTSMQKTSDGGYLLGGTSASWKGGDKSEDGKGKYDFWVLKINTNGDKEWDKTLGGKNGEDLKSVRQTPDGSYIVGGNSTSGISGNKTEVRKGLNDYWIVKLNPAGSIIWDKTIGGAKDTDSNLLVAFPAWDGGYLLCGTSTGVLAGNDRTETLFRDTELWVVKLLSETSTKALAFSSGSLKFTNDGDITTPEQLVNLSANTGTPAVKLRKSQADWLTIPASSRGSLPFTVNPADLLPAKYTSIVVATSPGYARAVLKVNLHVNDVTTPPVLNPINYQELAAGDTLTFTAKATTAIGQTKRFSLIGAPQGATIGASSGVFSWVPQSSGIYKFVVRISVAAAPELYDEETVTVKVVNSGIVTSVRINAGGGAYTTSDGRAFEADNYYDGVDRTSTIADADILNTTDDELYRSGRSSDYFNYNIPITSGIVRVTLHFAEIYWGVSPNRPGEKDRRRFNVSAEGVVKLNDYSIIGSAGGPLRAVKETFEVEVMDGILSLAFRSTSERRDKPRVSAIEVEFLESTSMATLSPVADADVSYGVNANTNYGNEPTISVKSTNVPELWRVSFLKFSLAGFSDINSAKFRIYGYNHQADTRVNLALAGLDNDDWTETGITASNAPAGVTTSLGTLSVTRKPEYFEVGITEFAKAQLARDKMLTLKVEETFGGKRILFNSKENAVNRPELIITTNGPVGSAARLAGEEMLDEVTEPDAASSVIYPNPVRTQFTLQIGNQHQENVTLQLFDEAGRAHQIKTTEMLHAGAKTEISIADLALSEGIYLLKVQSLSKSEILKVMVTK